MAKKVISLSSFLVLWLFASATFANGGMVAPKAPVAAAKDYFSGIYLGAGIGGAYYYDNWERDEQRIDSYIDNGVERQNVRNAVLDASTGKASFNGEVFLGYGLVFNSNYYLGAEIFGSMRNLNISITNEENDPAENRSNSFKLKIDNNDSYGGKLRFGYLVSPRTMLYAFAGIDVSRFESKFALAQTGVPEQSVEESHTKVGWMPGIGMETMLTDNLSLRTEGSYTWYNTLGYDATFSFGGDGYTNTNHISDTHKVRRGLFMLDLVYHFNN